MLRFDASGNLLGSFETQGFGDPLFLDAVAGQLTWTDLGNSLPGISGPPLLQGSGIPVPGGAVALDLASAAPSAPSVLVMGLGQANLPLFGGTLVPTPDVLIFGLPTNAAGAWSLPAAWPAALPGGFDLHLQAWITDASATQGFAASNAVRLRIP